MYNAYLYRMHTPERYLLHIIIIIIYKRMGTLYTRVIVCMYCIDTTHAYYIIMCTVEATGVLFFFIYRVMFPEAKPRVCVRVCAAYSARPLSGHLDGLHKRMLLLLLLLQCTLPGGRVARV